MDHTYRKLYRPYLLMLAVNLLFIITAFIHDAPRDIFRGMVKISLSRSVLITDYMAVGGLGAMLVNSAVVGIFCIIMLLAAAVKPNGSIIMALWLTAGFSMFGKNLFNMLPLTFGVWLYSRYRKQPFINFTLVALLSATLSPVVSGIAFHQDIPRWLSVPLGIFLGVFAGFIFPELSTFTVRVHGGFNLYNMGFAGGIISTLFVSVLASMNVQMDTELIWSEGIDNVLLGLLYVLSAGMFLYGLFFDKKFTPPAYRRFLRHSGRAVTDFYIQYGDSVYVNMGVLCGLSTTMLVLIGGDLNGPTLAGIFTIVGFGAFGKHLLNVLPVLIGAILSTHVNVWDPRTPSNTLAILFSTGLAPIAGQYGMIWGLIAGFLHVNLVMHISFLNSGLNLYNNGYAAGLVALLLLPIIDALKKEKD